MYCLICAKPADDMLCSKCSKVYLYDKKYKLIRRKKYLQERISTGHKDSINELRLHSLICKIYGRKYVIRHAHPLWAKSKKNVLLEYDIAVPSKKLLVEYDGKQHFVYPNFFHRTKKKFNAQVARDKLKNKLAVKHGFKLIRFSYKDKIDDINVERKIVICLQQQVK